MSEYTEVEQPFLSQLERLGWQVIDQGQDIPSDPTKSLRQNFRQWILAQVFEDAVRKLNKAPDGHPWLTARQLQDFQGQILQKPEKTPMEANEVVLNPLSKSQRNGSDSQRVAI